MILPSSITLLTNAAGETDVFVDRLTAISTAESVTLTIVSLSEYRKDAQLHALGKANNGPHALLLDTAIGYESSMDVLHSSQNLGRVPSIVFCIQNDEWDLYSDVLLRGAQEIFCPPIDSDQQLRRCLFHALQRTQILQASADVELRARAIIDNISDGVLIVDGGDTIEHCSRLRRCSRVVYLILPETTRINPG